jgi:hypothetical protein
VWLHSTAERSPRVGLPIRFVFALGIGFALPHPWALPLAAAQWPAGIWLGLRTGRYAFLGEFWQLVWFTSSAVGLVGIALGQGARRLVATI